MNKMYKKLSLVNTFAIGLMIVLNFLFCDNAKAQTTTILYSQNFQSTDFLMLPSGWTSNSTIHTGWYVDTTSSASDTTHHLGTHDLVVVNDTGIATDSVFSNSISTIGYDSIKVLWSNRVSHHFHDSASWITFAWSSNGGSTWDTVSTYQDTTTLVWVWLQDSTWLNLPPAASQQASIKFCWIAHINTVNTSGTVRISNIFVSGQSPSGIPEIYGNRPSPILFMQANNLLNVRMNNFSNGKVAVKVTNIDGALVYNSTIEPVDQTISMNKLASGVYIISMIANEGTYNQKLIVTH
jgi:hypothetical protein